MINHERFTLNGVVMKVLLSGGSSIWCLEAYKSKNVVAFLFNLDFLDSSELFEDFLKLLFIPFLWEVLDVEVASLL